MPNTSKLLASAAFIAALWTVPAVAQEKRGEEPRSNAPPQAQQRAPERAPPQAQQRAPEHAPPQARPTQRQEAPRAQAPRQAEPGRPTRNEAEAPRHAPNRAAEQHKAGPDRKAEQPDSGPKAAEQPKANPGQKAAEQPKPKEKSAAQPGTEPPRDKAAETKANEPNRNAADRGKSADAKVQLTQQQRADVRRDILRDRNVNRINVKIDARVGQRVPRSVRLAPVPAFILATYPAYRSYRYFVVNDEICFVDPATYEVVYVIDNEPGPTVARLTLSEQERMIVLREVDLNSGLGSTLGLGALSEGAPVPRGVQLHTLPVTVIDRIPRLQGYRYFVAEQRVAIVDPDERSVQLVIEMH